MRPAHKAVRKRRKSLKMSRIEWPNLFQGMRATTFHTFFLVSERSKLEALGRSRLVSARLSAERSESSSRRRRDVTLAMASVKKYLQLAEAGTTYAKKMNYLQNRIFGEIARPTSLPSAKVVKKLEGLPPYKDPDVVDYYHRLPESFYFFMHLRNYGLFRDQHADFKDEMKRLRKLRGKIRDCSWFKPDPNRPTKFASLKMK